MKQKFSFTMKSSTAKLASLSQFIEKILLQLKVNKAIHDDIIISIDEIATNIILHAYHRNAEKDINIVVTITDDKFQVDFFHTGDIFDPDAIPQPNLSPHLADRKKGGLGLYIVNTFMDDIKYTFKSKLQNKNIITITKYLQGGKIGIKNKKT